jgi:Spy/CpxP family protein refolding chaperone
MNAHRRIWLALPFAFLLPLGCNNGAETGQAAEPVAAEAPAAAPATVSHGHGHFRHHKSMARMMIHAARGLDLSDAQKATVDGLATSLRGQHTGPSAEQQAYHSALVQGVRAGNVDLVKLAPLQTSATTAHQARVTREATALNSLYAALTPAQRQSLVETVREHREERATRWAAHRQEKEASGSNFGQQRLSHLTETLGLDAAQQSQVQALMTANRPAPAAMQARHEARAARTDALLTAFAADGFDANKLELAPPVDAAMGPGMHGQFLAKLVPILRADQRETLASSMESRAQQQQ